MVKSNTTPRQQTSVNRKSGGCSTLPAPVSKRIVRSAPSKRNYCADKFRNTKTTMVKAKRSPLQDLNNVNSAPVRVKNKTSHAASIIPVSPPSHAVSWKVTKDAPYLAFIEGVALQSHTSASQPSNNNTNIKTFSKRGIPTPDPQTGRFLELPGIATTGTWYAHVTETENKESIQSKIPTSAAVPVLENRKRNSPSSCTQLERSPKRLCLRHSTMSFLPPIRSSPPGLSIATILPHITRLSALDYQGIFSTETESNADYYNDDTVDDNGDDISALKALKIESLSIISTQGYYSISECNEHAADFVESLLQNKADKKCNRSKRSKAMPCSKLLPLYANDTELNQENSCAKNNVVPQSRHHGVPVSGHSLPMTAMEADNKGIKIIIAVDDATQKIVAVDVVLDAEDTNSAGNFSGESKTDTTASAVLTENAVKSFIGSKQPLLYSDRNELGKYLKLSTRHATEISQSPTVPVKNTRTPPVRRRLDFVSPNADGPDLATSASKNAILDKAFNVNHETKLLSIKKENETTHHEKVEQDTVVVIGDKSNAIKSESFVASPIFAVKHYHPLSRHNCTPSLENNCSPKEHCTHSGDSHRQGNAYRRHYVSDSDCYTFAMLSGLGGGCDSAMTDKDISGSCTSENPSVSILSLLLSFVIVLTIVVTVWMPLIEKYGS